MTWYTASIISAIFDPLDREAKVRVFEDFILLEAESRETALAEANRIGEDGAAIDDGVTICGRSAKRTFSGVRKLRSIYSNRVGDVDELPPVSGTELTHSYFEVADLGVARRLANGTKELQLSM